MKTKICSQCNIEKPASEFYSGKRCKDGLQSRCKSCDKTYREQYYKTNSSAYKTRSKEQRKKSTEEYIAWKNEQQCCVCGESDDACLDAHHLDPAEKEYKLSELGSRAFGSKKWYAELSKCIIVCSNCHRKIHKHGIDNVLVAEKQLQRIANP